MYTILVGNQTPETFVGFAIWCTERPIYTLKKYHRSLKYLNINTENAFNCDNAVHKKPLSKRYSERRFTINFNSYTN